MPLQLANRAQTTLASGITAGATSITVSSATGFSTSVPFRVLVLDSSGANAEFMDVTAVAGTTWTVTRAVEDATRFPAYAFPSGSAVAQVLTAGVLKSLLSTESVVAPYCTVVTQTNTTQTFLSNGVATALLYDAEAADNYSMFPGSMSGGLPVFAGAIRLAYSGLWEFNASIIFNAAALTGPCSAAFYNETQFKWFGGDDRYYSNRTNPSLSVVGKTPANANDEIRVYVVNNSGTSLTTFAASSGAGPSFTASLAGPS